MANLFKRIGQAVAIYKIADVAYSIWAGKSLMWLAVLAWAPVVIATIANGFKWGYLDKIFLMAASIYVVLAFAWLATILAYRKISPKNKFKIIGFGLLVPVGTKIKNRGVALTAVGCRLNLKNDAEFPISYKVTQADWKINKVSEDAANYDNTGAEIAAFNPTNFDIVMVKFDHPLELMAGKPAVEGRLKVTVKYGHPGREKFTLSRNMIVRVVFDDKNAFGATGEFRDLDPAKIEA
jgi:hypothetical protein